MKDGQFEIVLVVVDVETKWVRIANKDIAEQIGVAEMNATLIWLPKNMKNRSLFSAIVRTFKKNNGEYDFEIIELDFNKYA